MLLRTRTKLASLLPVRPDSEALASVAVASADTVAGTLDSVATGRAFRVVSVEARPTCLTGRVGWPRSASCPENGYVPSLAAREVAVSSLATVYALSATAGDAAQALAPLIAQGWRLATALSLMAWYVFAPQCLSTLATVKRETGGWTVPLVMGGYLFALVYAASFATCRTALAMGAG